MKNEYWTDYVQKLESTLSKIKEKGLKHNIGKSFFRQTEMEYLGFWVTRDGVKPIDKSTRKRKKCDATDLPKRITAVYRCIELLT